MFLLFIYASYFLSTIFLIFIISLIYYLAKTRVPFVRTPAENIKIIFDELNLNKDFLIYDLGSGDGTALFKMESLGYRAVGYEVSLYPFLKALLKKNIKRSSVTFYRKDFSKINLGKADVIYIFLVKKVMAKIGDKLKNELKPNAIVISYGFTLPGWRIEKIINTQPSKTYIYKA